MTTWGFTLENVSVGWTTPERPIFEKMNLAFTITQENKGLLPLMGPSGQGKSTLLYLLATLKRPSTGRIIWQFPEGETHILTPKPFDQEDSAWLRQKKFGFAFQNSTLSPHLTVLENIAYPLLTHGKTWQNALKLAEKTLDKVLLPTEKEEINRLWHRFPSQLSGGQRQRVALAQAMIHDPTVIFADEPTGQLDKRTRQQVMNVLKEWVAQAQGQRCLIWVTHHHIGDLDLMGINELFFLENGECLQRDRDWLKTWG